ncbi:hypothetical protein ACJMK2_016811 [Sinanodonta woodiana]|uniref:Interferon-related developmental regulator 1 n=1 Tax=Sinanodonta woodiana TaxID=1069815 RepID=A0ABD3UW60_SINWO
MPKGKKKGGRKADSRPPSDEEYDTGDNLSTTSVLSDDQSGSIPEEGADEVDEDSAQEQFEEKLKDCIDGLSQKSAQGRKTCLEGIIKAFSKKYLYEFLQDRKMTVSDALIRCLKKGNGDEQALAAKCYSLLCIQLGPEAESLVLELQPVLLSIIADNSACLKARGECAITVVMCVFIASSDLEQVAKVLEVLECVFKLSFRKGDGTIPNHSLELCKLHAHCLQAWSLLMTVASSNVVQVMVQKYLAKFADFLHSPDLELRIVAGETIALIYEMGRDEEDDFGGSLLDDLCEILKNLATDSHKYRAKRDRKQQRSSFRDILRAVQDGDAPEMTVRFGQEQLEVYSWIGKIKYNAFCHALTSGMYQHLQKNPLVRDVFELGEPMIVGSNPAQKQSKWERTMYNAAVFKARTKARSKCRDKRSVTANGGD